MIAERAGFERWVRSITVERGTTTKLTIPLSKKTSTRDAPPGVRSMVDDTPHDVSPPTSVPAGTHRVTAALGGHRAARVEVRPHEGKSSGLAIGIDTPSRFTGRRKLALAMGGASLVATGIGVMLGLQARQLDDDAFALCPSPSTPCPDAQEANELNLRGRSRALQANMALGVAGGAAITAVALWLTGAPESRVAVTPQVGTVAGLDVAVRF